MYRLIFNNAERTPKTSAINWEFRTISISWLCLSEVTNEISPTSLPFPLWFKYLHRRPCSRELVWSEAGYPPQLLPSSASRPLLWWLCTWRKRVQRVAKRESTWWFNIVGTKRFENGRSMWYLNCTKSFENEQWVRGEKGIKFCLEWTEEMKIEVNDGFWPSNNYGQNIWTLLWKCAGCLFMDIINETIFPGWHFNQPILL